MTLGLRCLSAQSNPNGFSLRDCPGAAGPNRVAAFARTLSIHRDHDPPLYLIRSKCSLSTALQSSARLCRSALARDAARLEIDLHSLFVFVRCKGSTAGEPAESANSARP
jgi:hypothetical protein